MKLKNNQTVRIIIQYLMVGYKFTSEFYRLKLMSEVTFDNGKDGFFETLHPKEDSLEVAIKNHFEALERRNKKEHYEEDAGMTEEDHHPRHPDDN